MPRKPLLSILLASLLAACASQPPAPAPDDSVPPVPDEVFTGWLSSFKHCREKYAEIDAKIDAAGVRDAGYYRVPGFPYFRTDRTLASFKDEVQTVDEVGGWVRRMREFDQEAREFELENLGLPLQQRAALRFDLLACGRGLASIELDNPETLKLLLARVEPPVDYTGRSAAPKPDAKLREQLAARRQAILDDFRRPFDASAPARLWQIKPEQDLALIDRGYGNVIADELGFPGLIDSAWAALAEKHAPRLWIETAGDADQLGTPHWRETGLDIDTATPETHYQVTFTRFGAQRLPQINYLFWFKGRDGAPLDSFIWRVTLDYKAEPLVYEILHLSGRDHELFPAQPLALRDVPPDGSLPPLLPQRQLPAGPLVLRIAAGSHGLRRIVAMADTGHAEVHEFRLRRYEDLTAMKRPDGTTRSLFGPDGTIPGVRDPDPFWTYGTGIVKPGALRQLGHQVADYVAPRAFDDPFLLETIFAAIPQPPSLVTAGTK